MISTNYPSPDRRVNYGWIKESFALFQKDAGVWLACVAIYFIVALGVSFGIQAIFIQTGHSPLPPPGTVVSSPLDIYTPNYFAYLGVCTLFGIPFGGFIAGGFMNMGNKVVRGQKLSIGDFFTGGPTTLNFILLNIIVGLSCYSGLIACVIGILASSFIGIGLLSPAYSLVADGENVLTAVRISFNAMKADWLNATGFAVVLVGLYFVSACCIVGVFVTIPMCIICTSLMTRDMIGMTGIRFQGSAPDPNVPGSWPPPPM